MSDQDETKENQEMQAALALCIEKNRRETFKKWVFPDTANASAAKLAEAGFIFIGNKHDPDAVKCFLCDKHLENWDEDDDPWSEHLKHAQNCSFAKLHKPEKNLTLGEFIDIRNELIEILIKRKFHKEKELIDQIFDKAVELIASLKRV